MAITSLSEPESVSAANDYLAYAEDGSAHRSVSIFAGLVLSLAGVVLATAGPAMFFLRERNGTA
jgi:hypothetical protein